MKKYSWLLCAFFLGLLGTFIVSFSKTREGAQVMLVNQEEGASPWKINVNKKKELVFEYKGKSIAKLTPLGEFSSKKCKCGQWNIRDSRMGIPGRNDMNLHKDGWFRALQYDSPEVSTGLHKHSDFNKGGFAGRNLWYGGSFKGRMIRG